MSAKIADMNALSNSVYTTNTGAEVYTMEVYIIYSQICSNKFSIPIAIAVLLRRHFCSSLKYLTIIALGTESKIISYFFN